MIIYKRHYTHASIVRIHLPSTPFPVSPDMDMLTLVTNNARVDKLISAFLTDSRLALVSAFLLVVIGTYIARGVYRKLHTAPGPRRLPLLGNVLQIPAELQFLRYTEWAQEYGAIEYATIHRDIVIPSTLCVTGSIFSLDVPGLHVVVLNTYEGAADIFGEDVY